MQRIGSASHFILFFKARYVRQKLMTSNLTLSCGGLSSTSPSPSPSWAG